MATAFATMTDAELNEFFDDANEFGDHYPQCPHCDGGLHGPTTYCWCLPDCEACARVREGAAAFDADMKAAAAEWERRHPTPPPAPVALELDDCPF